jgi:arylsulfatase A-like enzyme
MEPGEFEGVAGRTLEESTPWWPPLPSAPEGAPNVVVVLLDDVGYAQFGCYGSTIATPTFDRLAERGLRYSNFHTTALCSPTRACLLTGRNHHRNGMGRIVEFASGFPGYDATMPKANGMISEILVRNGYATFAVGKWHLAPAGTMVAGGPRDRWPLGRGFERFYGFLGGETDQYHPDLVHDNHQIDPPRSPEQGYHLTEDMVDVARLYLTDLRAASPTKPFFLWFAPGACHAPHQVPREWSDKYKGAFDHGWDAYREEVFAKQMATGLVPAGTELSDRPHWIAAWDSLTDDERRLYARMMEVYAGFLEHTDAQVGKVLDFIEELGETDNTIVVVMSDNGASAEGGPRGSFNEMYFFNGQPESLEENLKRIDLLGTPEAHNHYAWGWAWAGNTPLKRWKRETHEGGVADPLIVHWPRGMGQPGDTRHQYVHAIDLLPTLLDVIGIEGPETIAGVTQQPFDGVSFAHTFSDGAAASRHITQYYEMMSCRAIYHDGWKAVTFHPLMLAPYDGSDPRRPFDEDEWELYHVAEDFAETTDLAAKEPDRLAEMIELWWSEAERNQVLPITNMPGLHGDRRHRRNHYEYYAGISSLPDAVAPNLRNRSWQMTAEIDNTNGDAAGVIANHGGAAGGYAIYVKDHRLCYVDNFLGTETTIVRADVPLPRARVTVKCTFASTGTFGGGGDVELFHDDAPVGSGKVPRTVPISFGMSGFEVGYQRGPAITSDYDAPYRFTAERLGKVTFDVEGRAKRDAAAQDRIANAIQ